MFKNQIRITGKHAEILKKYSKASQAGDRNSFMLNNHEGTTIEKYLFARMIDCMMVATMLGIINDRIAPEHDPTGQYATIFVEVLIKERGTLERICHHMELKTIEGTPDEKIKKVFSTSLSDNDKKIRMSKFMDYFRGGLEIIDEMFSSAKTYEDLCNTLIQFREDYDFDLMD